MWVEFILSSLTVVVAMQVLKRIFSKEPVEDPMLIELDPRGIDFLDDIYFSTKEVKGIYHEIKKKHAN